MLGCSGAAYAAAGAADTAGADDAEKDRYNNGLETRTIFSLICKNEMTLTKNGSGLTENSSRLLIGGPD